MPRHHHSVLSNIVCRRLCLYSMAGFRAGTRHGEICSPNYPAAVQQQRHLASFRPVKRTWFPPAARLLFSLIAILHARLTQLGVLSVLGPSEEDDDQPRPRITPREKSSSRHSWKLDDTTTLAVCSQQRLVLLLLCRLQLCSVTRESETRQAHVIIVSHKNEPAPPRAKGANYSTSDGLRALSIPFWHSRGMGPLPVIVTWCSFFATDTSTWPGRVNRDLCSILTPLGC